MRSNLLAAWMRPLTARVRNFARRGLVRMATESTKLRELQVQTGPRELRDRVEHFEPFGFTSRPRAGAEAVVLNLGADRAQSVAIVVADRRYRLQGLADGDVAIHSDAGARVVLRSGGRIEVYATERVTVTAPTLALVGNLEVDGNIVASGDVEDGTASMAEDRTVYNSHTHAGVQTGSGTTATPLPLQQ